MPFRATLIIPSPKTLTIALFNQAWAVFIPEPRSVIQIAVIVGSKGARSVFVRFLGAI